MAITEPHSGSIPEEFEKVIRVETPHHIPITKYRSTRAGYHVVVADIKVPLVSGYFAVATEANCDNGCPHTLEHLIFLGSEDYPYKGVLDSFANKVYARGTNAWTDVDHTCYTIKTAGAEGFLNILPVYLDHILFPTITQQGFLTEVHHINGKANDAGVVYCEMQSRQNTQYDRMTLEMQRGLYPAPCGYSYETGGLVEELRKLDVDTVRKFHRDFYTGSNLSIFVSGNISHEELLKALIPVSDKIIKKQLPERKKRPFVDDPPVPTFAKTMDKEILFPDEDETIGGVMIAWQGPSINDFEELHILEVLLLYLTDSAVAPLNLKFVEVQPCLATDVDFAINEHLITSHMVFFNNVPTEKLSKIKPKFFEVLKEIVEKKDFDMDRLGILIERRRLSLMDYVEMSPSSAFAHICIEEFLYGASDGSHLAKSFTYAKDLEKMKTYTKDFWLSKMKEYMQDRPYLSIRGKPSAKYAVDLNLDETKRVEKQAAEIGKEKLAKLDEELEEAMNYNDRKIPQGVLDAVPVPKGEIQLAEIETARIPCSTPNEQSEFQKQMDERLGGRSLPFVTQFSRIPSNFVELALYIDTRDLMYDERELLELYLRSFFTLPVKLTSTTKVEGYEEIVRQLNRLSVSHGSSCGLSNGGSFSIGSFEELVVFSIKFEPHKYNDVVNLLTDLISNSVFDVARLRVVGGKLLNSIPEIRREPIRVALHYLRDALIGTESNFAALDPFQQERFLSELLAEDGESDVEDIKQSLEDLREKLLSPQRMRATIVGDIDKIEDPFKVLIERYKPNSVPPNPIRLTREFLTNLGVNPTSVGQTSHSKVIALGSTESSYVISAAKGPYPYSNKDIVPLLLVSEYLQAMEGPFWKQIRGEGLAYNFSIDIDAACGLLFFTISRSTNCSKAFLKAKDIVADLASCQKEFDRHMLESARGSLVYQLVAREGTPKKAAMLSWINQEFRGVGKNHTKEMVEKAQTIKQKELLDVLKRYLVPLFNPETCVLVSVAAPSLAEGIRETFEKDLGFYIPEVQQVGMDEGFEGEESE